jgi:acyl-CoA thioesterase
MTVRVCPDGIVRNERQARKLSGPSLLLPARLALVVSAHSMDASSHVIDRALELVRAAESPNSLTAVFGARLDRKLWVADVGPWGGYVAALLAKAVGVAVPEFPTLSLTVHFLHRLRVGDVQVTVDIETRGSRVAHVVSRITQDDRTGAIALATLGRNPQDDFVSDFPRPPAPPPEEVPRRAESSHPYMQHLDVRPTVIARPWSGDNEGTLAGWIRLVDPRALDLPLLAALPDAWMPGTWARLREPSGKVTVDQTTHFRGDIAPDDDGWWFLRVRTRHVERGFADEECEVWGADGRLLVQSRQLVLLAR